MELPKVGFPKVSEYLIPLIPVYGIPKDNTVLSLGIPVIRAVHQEILHILFTVFGYERYTVEKPILLKREL